MLVFSSQKLLITISTHLRHGFTKRNSYVSRSSKLSWKIRRACVTTSDHHIRKLGSAELIINITSKLKIVIHGPSVFPHPHHNHTWFLTYLLGNNCHSTILCRTHISDKKTIYKILKSVWQKNSRQIRSYMLSNKNYKFKMLQVLFSNVSSKA